MHVREGNPLNQASIGLVCLGRETFDIHTARSLYEEKQAELLTNYKNIKWCIYKPMVIEEEDAVKAVSCFKDEGVDGLIILSGTFHLGHLALILKVKLEVPVLLWTLKELPYDGGKIRLNALCGLNLNASNLYKAGYDDVDYCLDKQPDYHWIKAIIMKKNLHEARIGLVGAHAHGFFNLDLCKLTLFQEMNILVDTYTLTGVYNQLIEEKVLSEMKQLINNTFRKDYVTKNQVNMVIELAAKIKSFMDQNRLHALAIRCWPEFARDYGISPCAAMSILQSQGYILACEGDLEGALTMYLSQTLTKVPPFLADFSQINLEEDYALMWHCGVAPTCLWDKKSERSLDPYFAGGKGVTADFVLKPGVVTLFRIDHGRGKTRIFLATGNVVEMTKELKGTYGKLYLTSHVKDVLESIIVNGIAHHVVMLYGQHDKTISKFAKLMNWEIIKRG